MGADAFSSLQATLRDTVSAWTVGLSNTRVGIVTFADTANVHASLVDVTSVAALQSSIFSIEQTTTTGVDASAALSLARSMFRDVNQARPAAVDTIIFITDSTSLTNPTTAAATLRAEDAFILVIGVGDGVSPTQLANIATNGPVVISSVASLDSSHIAISD
jgi:deleted-in-malignant-brain-tumors protein 1